MTNGEGSRPPNPSAPEGDRNGGGVGGAGRSEVWSVTEKLYKKPERDETTAGARLGGFQSRNASAARAIFRLVVIRDDSFIFRKRKNKLPKSNGAVRLNSFQLFGRYFAKKEARRY